MADNLSIFNPSVGISGITTPRSEDISISGHKGAVSPALSISGNEQGLEHYDGRNLDTVIDAYLCPKSADPDLMSPRLFHGTVQSALEKLGQSGDDRELTRLSEDIGYNNDIVRMFSSLVIPG